MRRKQKKQAPVEVPKRRIVVSTSYGHLEIVNLKRVWVNNFMGYKLMYSDDIYEYNCIYWSNNRRAIDGYLELKDKLINAYNNGDTFVEL